MSTDNCEPPFAPAFVAREVGYLHATRDAQVWVVAGARLKQLVSLRLVRLRSRLLVASASIEIRPAIAHRTRRRDQTWWTFKTTACNVDPETRNSQLVTLLRWVDADR